MKLSATCPVCRTQFRHTTTTTDTGGIRITCAACNAGTRSFPTTEEAERMWNAGQVFWQRRATPLLRPQVERAHSNQGS